jgi:hypothetical protein
MKVEILSGGPCGAAFALNRGNGNRWQVSPLVLRMSWDDPLQVLAVGDAQKQGLTLIFSRNIICMLTIFHNEVTHEQ